MKKNLLHLLLALSAFVFVFVSCSDDNDEPAHYADYTCLVVNQGNFSEKTGSISYYRESDNTIVNGAFEKANGRKLASIIESVTVSGTTALVVCNSPDKIEIINVNTAKVLSAPIEGDDVVNPRYAVVTGDYAYISCWGAKETAQGWFHPEAYLLKINLKSKEIIKKIDCGSDAEGLLLIGNKLYVAVKGGVEVYDITTDTKVNEVLFTTLSDRSRQLTVDKNGMIWCSVENFDADAKKGIGVINPETMTIVAEIAGYNIGSQICTNKAKDKVVFYLIDIDAATWKINASDVYTIDVDLKTISEKPLFKGDHLYGINVNPKTGVFYTAEVFGFTGNSMLKTFNEQGASVNQAEAGVAACRFVFF